MCAVGFLGPTAPLAQAQERATDGPAVYVSFPDMDAESQDVAQLDWIDMLSVEWGAAGNSAPEARSERRCAGYRTGSAVVGAVTLTRVYDVVPFEFARACAEGTHFATMVIETTSKLTGSGRHMRYELRDVLVTRHSIDAAGDQPTESISLEYTKVDSRAIPATQRGKLDPAWDPEFAGPN